MKQNKYDDEKFFEQYSQMNRSRLGLEGAGEWETLKGLLPDFAGKRVLDLGCGYGWHCAYAVENGAKSVVGVDISEKMLAVANEKNGFPNVEYICKAVEDIEFENESFDIVLSSLTFHYLQSFEQVAKKVNLVLKNGGAFVFSVEHPVFTAYGTQDWYYGDNGEILHFPVDNYFIEGQREAIFLGESVTKYHKTMTTYIDGLLQNGFSILRLVEPQPTQKMLDEIDGMRDELRRPMMLIISAEKL